MAELAVYLYFTTKKDLFTTLEIDIVLTFLLYVIIDVFII